MASSGSIVLVGYTLTHSISGQCNASILNTQVSGTTSVTPPYTIAWSGVGGYTASTFDIADLCTGEYEAIINDVSGNTGTTSVVISAITQPSISARLSNDDMITNPNKLGTITISTSTTETDTFKYKLYKDNKLLETYYGRKTSPSHTFSDIKNGMYSVVVVEDRPLTVVEKPDNTGCTAYDYNSSVFNGWEINTTSIFPKWGQYIPFAPAKLSFSNGWGPNSSGVNMYFETGIQGGGTIATSNPFAWLYTGTTSTRQTNSDDDWYFGVSAITMNEGEDLGPSTISAVVANIGKFYYNSVINKIVMMWPADNSTIRWVTINPTQDYGHAGNPIAAPCTGATYGVYPVAVQTTDYTVNGAGVVVDASTILTGAFDKFKMGASANNSQATGMVSLCSYNNYTWETSLNSTHAAGTPISLILASFRDEEGKYGVTGLTHTLSLVMYASSGKVYIHNNYASGYGFNLTNTTQFLNCAGGCTSINNLNYGQSTVLGNAPPTTPFSATGNWSAMGSVRVKVVRSGYLGENFHIQFTDTMGTGSATIAAGTANPYNSLFDINFNLIDKVSWSGSSESAPTWAAEDSLCKYLGSRRIGFWQISQPSTNYYHMTLTGSPSESYIVAPTCGFEDGPSNEVIITATTGTTANIIQTAPRPNYTSTQVGVPQIRPTVNVTLQNMEEPVLDMVGLSRPNLSLTDNIGGVPALAIYNSDETKDLLTPFYFGGNNTDMIFGDMYAKFSIYPYIFESEVLSSVPEYEKLFDKLPEQYVETSKSILLSGDTILPLSSFCSNSTWEYILRPSYLFKDKTSKTDVWVDNQQYPILPKINPITDFYLALVNNPPVINLNLSGFNLPNYTPSLHIENVVVRYFTESSAKTFIHDTYIHTLENTVYSKPLVTANGVVLVNGTSATSSTTASGDYRYYPESKTVMFFPETVENGDTLQFMYDAGGGSYTQFLTIPATASTSSADTFYTANGYYYINLDKQSIGAVMLAINGLAQRNNVGYRKVSDSRIQLMLTTSSYNAGDVIAMFYRTIYQVIGLSLTKEPVIPVTYTKVTNLVEDIIIKLLDSVGNVIQESSYTSGVDVVGNIKTSFKLIVPEPGTYNYIVMIKRHYPLINGETTITESQTDTVEFTVTRDNFYTQ